MTLNNNIKKIVQDCLIQNKCILTYNKIVTTQLRYFIKEYTMSSNTTSIELPDYDTFTHTLNVLALPFSSSELHGMICGYLASNATLAGESYLRALIGHKKDDATRAATLALFNLYTITQQQLSHLGFHFQLLLPDENAPLTTRAQAFSEWCEGFTHGLSMAGVDYHQFHDEETQEALQHITEFAQLDYEAIQVSTEDENALMEVYEYARMAVLHIHGDLHANPPEDNDTAIAH